VRARRGRRNIEIFSLSFMDCICCGFGAIILMLTLSRWPSRRPSSRPGWSWAGASPGSRKELHVVRGESEVLDRELRSRVRQVSEERARVARLQGDMSKLQGEFAASKELSAVSELLEGRLLAAQQSLTEEMKRLQAESERRPPVDALVAGVPVDSEYVVFIIDTSGSMQRYAWPALNRKMSQISTPIGSQGMRVMNDGGEYMFTNLRGEVDPRYAARRQPSWNGWRAGAPSAWRPRRRDRAAIRHFAAADGKIGSTCSETSSPAAPSTPWCARSTA
jgi:hypothetical protein